MRNEFVLKSNICIFPSINVNNKKDCNKDFPEIC